MLKILHIDSESSWRGGENQLKLLIEGLSKLGVESHVACPKGSELAKRLFGIPRCFIIELPLRGGFNPRALVQLLRYIKSNAISIIDCHSGNAHTLGLAVKTFIPHLKLVIHRRVDNIPKGGFFNHAKYLSPKIDRYVAISSAIANVLANYGISRQKIEVVKSAVPLDEYASIDKLAARRDLAHAFGIKPETCLIGNASALSPQKGYDDLFYAASYLKEQNLDFHIFIAGEGELRDQLEALRAHLGLEHHITMLGFIKEVREFLSALDVLAVPSINEGLGTIILDGIGAGLCVAASNVGGIPEIITHGETGLLSPPRSPRELSENLKALIIDQSLRRSLAKKSLAYIMEYYHVDKMVSENLAIYHHLSPN